MGILDLLIGKKDYITIVKEFIFKVFVHEAKRFGCLPKDIKIVIDCDENNNLGIITFLNKTNKTERVIPDSEVQDILIK